MIVGNMSPNRQWEFITHTYHIMDGRTEQQSLTRTLGNKKGQVASTNLEIYFRSPQKIDKNIYRHFQLKHKSFLKQRNRVRVKVNKYPITYSGFAHILSDACN